MPLLVKREGESEEERVGKEKTLPPLPNLRNAGNKIIGILWDLTNRMYNQLYIGIYMYMYIINACVCCICLVGMVHLVHRRLAT